VDEFQGYYFARPMALDAWLALLQPVDQPLPVLPLARA
jgi:EAL domain-containing protein (putative c-di-GMP-specific phosphodiesterase class I)